MYFFLMFCFRFFRICLYFVVPFFIGYGSSFFFSINYRVFPTDLHGYIVIWYLFLGLTLGLSSLGVILYHIFVWFFSICTLSIVQQSLYIFIIHKFLIYKYFFLFGFLIILWSHFYTLVFYTIFNFFVLEKVFVIHLFSFPPYITVIWHFLSLWFIFKCLINLQFSFFVPVCTIICPIYVIYFVIVLKTYLTVSFIFSFFHFFWRLVHRLE